MTAANRKDPYCTHNFRVKIEGLAIAGFMECHGLESETEVIEYREGSDFQQNVRKLPGLTKYANIILKRGVSASKDLYDWRKEVLNGIVQRKKMTIVLLDEKRAPVAYWNFRECWPCGMSGPTLNALENAVGIEELEICHEGFERE